MESVMEESEFREVLAVLEGARRPLNAKASKVLAFMLEQREGCDATIEPGRFEIRSDGTLPGTAIFRAWLPPSSATYLNWLGRRGMATCRL